MFNCCFRTYQVSARLVLRSAITFHKISADKMYDIPEIAKIMDCKTDTSG